MYEELMALVDRMKADKKYDERSDLIPYYSIVIRSLYIIEAQRSRKHSFRVSFMIQTGWRLCLHAPS